MKWPAFSGTDLMAVVVVAAVNFAVIWAGFRHGNGSMEASLRVGLLILGVLPMINILGLGLWIGRRSPRSRRFLLGFESFAAVETALFLAGALLIDANSLHFCIDPPLRSLQQIVFGRTNMFTRSQLTVLLLIVSAIFVVPQVALASIGGLLSHLLEKAMGRPPTV